MAEAVLPRLGHPSPAADELMIGSFANLTPTQAILAGGKGWMLARLYQAGFRVPDGFVVLTSAFENDALKEEAWAQAQAGLAKLRDVRSGAARSPSGRRHSVKTRCRHRSQVRTRPFSMSATTRASGVRSRPCAARGTPAASRPTVLRKALRRLVMLPSLFSEWSRRSFRACSLPLIQ